MLVTFFSSRDTSEFFKLIRYNVNFGIWNPYIFCWDYFMITGWSSFAYGFYYKIQSENLTLLFGCIQMVLLFFFFFKSLKLWKAKVAIAFMELYSNYFWKLKLDRDNAKNGSCKCLLTLTGWYILIKSKWHRQFWHII